MNWERSLDIIIAVLVVALIHFVVQLFEVIETTALWGAEAPHRKPTATTLERHWERFPYEWKRLPPVEPRVDATRGSH